MSSPEQKPEPQVGVILVTHADYGAGLLRAAAFILGDQKGCATVGVDGSLDVKETVATLNSLVKTHDQGKGVIILTDMFGGTPTNLSLSLLKGNEKLEVVTGVNLPMLLKVLGSRGNKLDVLAKDAAASGCQGIVAAGEVLRSKVKGKQ